MFFLGISNEYSSINCMILSIKEKQASKASTEHVVIY